MKLNKIISLAAASLALLAVSCTPDVTPAGDASVGFEKAELETGLGSPYLYIPIVTEGETTVYPIKVNIEVDEYTGDFAAKEDVDYMITSKEIYVASPESKPVVEVKILNPTDSDALYFNLKIASQENAQKISQGTIAVRCVKGDLDRVCGQYAVVGQTHQGAPASETWTVSNSDGKVLISGMFGETGAIAGEYKDNVLTFPLGSGSGNMIGAYNFGDPIGVGYVCPTLFSMSAGLEENPHELKIKVSEDFKSLTLDIAPYEGIALGIYTYDDAQTFTGYMAGTIIVNNNTVTKKK